MSNPTTEAELENHLRALYRAEDPPAGLTARILSAAQRRRPARGRRRRRTALLGLCSALLAVCVYLAIGVIHQRQAQNRRAREAQAHLLYALQITTGELNWAEATIHRDMAAGPQEVNR
ncbi:MAG: hypothetical protein ACRD04_07910 [Terriglobales bacterium]